MAVGASSAAAQTPPAPPSTPAAPAAPTPLAKPTPTPQAASSAETRSALKLAGLVTFVANVCPTLRPDYAVFEQALAALGVTTADLEKGEMKAGYLAYTTRYNADAKASCERANAQFGPHGSTLPGLFQPR